MSKLTPFQTAALDFDKHVSLTANAGSGKTFVFAKRFVQIAVSKGVNLQNIIAITFTDKAAGELNKRIAREVEERLENEKDSTLVKKLKGIRQRLVSANISTIHSFCIELLKEYSPEAGLDANFTPLDPRLANELLELSLDESIASFVNDESLFEDYKYFVRLFGSKSLFRKELVSLVDKRKTILQLSDKLYSGTDEEVISYYRNLFERDFSSIFLKRIREIIFLLKRINENVLAMDLANKYALEIAPLLGDLDECDDVKKLYKLLEKISELMLTKSSGEVKKRDYAKKNLPSELSEEINKTEEFFNDFKSVKFNSEEELTEELVNLARKFLRLFLVIEKNYTKKKQSRGYLDFEDILLYTLKLTSNKEIIEQLGNKYKFIMIDEYQDTNDVQYNIFMPVLDNLKKGNLFVVGDEKQSIYMFRDADIAIYKQTNSDLKSYSNESKILNLPHSFRMLPNIAAFTNKLFRKLFTDPKEIFNEVEHSELICANTSGNNGCIEFIIKTAENNIDESVLVQRKIVELLNSQQEIKFSDIAILCRKRSNFKQLEKVLGDSGIPYIVVGGRGFYQQQVVGDVYNYLSFLMDRKNNGALIGILRSPFFMMSDANIYELSREKGETYFDKLKNYIKHKIYFQNVLTILDDHIEKSATHDIAQLIRIILNDTGYWALISGKVDSSQKIKNLEKLIGIAASYSLQEFSTLYDFVQFLKTSMESTEDEGQAVIDDSIDAVRLMTIHQSKGLEFRAVFLYKCHEYGKNSRLTAKQIEIDRNYGILSKIYINNNYFGEALTPPAVGLYNYIVGKKHNAELKRLLYVAVTRAVEYLFISGDVSSKLRETSFLGLMQDGLSINFTDEEFLISDTLKFMEDKQGEYIFYDKDVKINIPIIKEIPILEMVRTESTKSNFEENIINIDEIPDGISKEIVSATKIAVFKQCPVKYYLTYGLGYSDIASLVKTNTNNFDYKFKEDEETFGYGDLKGRIIHEVLDAEGDIDESKELVDKLLDRELSENFISGKKDELQKEINVLLEKYFASDTFKKIKEYEKFENEYEIYAVENDYYLYGIIDKLVFTHDRIIIIDYKTDRINENEINERGENYIPQLMFYANILRKKYTDYNEYELHLVFLNHPELIYKKVITVKELEQFNFQISRIIHDIRNENFEANKNHCPLCHFSIGKTRCINEKI